ncbi:Uncharacterized protein TPAR_06539 [Tolypocladium paradoxum]|uniref:Uncharacterized protein n=1 Tax=Tolypocladium paradoxum TaxID=94208 RepID=A0A2S4KSV1_9HYPO|nr:Uncharacterized protein TPAR_06539 [Tolypocladium paradoxum]
MSEAILPGEPRIDKCLSPGQLLPTRDSLIELREKFLSAFDVASILESQCRPWYYIHRDLGNPGPSRAPIGPIPGNDFHATDRRIMAHLPGWGSKLQFDLSGQKNRAGPQLLVVPFKHINDHPDPGPGDVKKVEESAELIRSLWSDASIGQPRRRHVGSRVTDCSAPEYHIFHWLASKQLNGEGVAMRRRSLASTGRFAGSDSGDALTFIGDWSDEEINDAPMPSLPSSTRLQGKPFSSAQIWACLSPLGRLLIAGCTCTSFSHFYTFDPTGPPSEKDAGGDSGMQVDRGHFTLPVELGDERRDMTFTERRTWIGMRIATEYRGETPDASPSVVGVILTDTGHYRLSATDKAWDERGLHSSPSARGVALFQMVLWTSLDYWETCWCRCLDFVEQTFKIRLESQDNVDQLEKLISDPSLRSSKTCTRFIMLLSSFRSHITLVAG